MGLEWLTWMYWVFIDEQFLKAMLNFFSMVGVFNVVVGHCEVSVEVEGVIHVWYMLFSCDMYVKYVPLLGGARGCPVCMTESWQSPRWGYFECFECKQSTCYDCSGRIMVNNFQEYISYNGVTYAICDYVCPFCRAECSTAFERVELPFEEWNLHVVPSSLNGNNGEFTNGDDLAHRAGRGGERGTIDNALEQVRNAAELGPPAEPTTHYQARRRRQHQSNPGGGGRRSGRGAQAPGAPPAPNVEANPPPLNPNHIPPEPIVPPQEVGLEGDIVEGVAPGGKKKFKTSYVVHVECPILAYDGEEFFVPSEPTVFGGVLVDCYKSNVGHYSTCYVGEVPTGNHPEYAVPPLERVDIPAYRRRDVSDRWMDIPASSYLVLEPLWRMFMKSYRSPSVSEQISKAVLAHCAGYNQYRGVPPAFFRRLCEDTGLAFLGRLHHMDSTRLSGTFVRTLVTNNFSTVGVDGNELYRNILQAKYGLTDFNEPVRVYDVDAIMPHDYLVRGDFKVKTHGGVYTDPEGRPVFPSTGKPISRYRTVFFSFSGHNQAEWCEHAPTAYNLNRALKRMLGGKANEGIDRRTAIHFGDCLGFHFSRTNDETSFMVAKLLNGREAAGSVHDFDTENARIFVNFLSGLVGLGNLDDRALLHVFNEAIYDPIATAGSWAYAKVWEMKAIYLNPWFNRNACSEIVHIKAALRKSYHQGKLYSDPSDIYVRRLEAKLKREIAKAGRVPKPARLTVSYQEGCMYANELPEYVKMAINGCHRMRLSEDVYATIIIVGKPKDHPLSQRFRILIDAVSIPGECCALIFSDDFCLSGCVERYSFAGNGDISSNDSSQDIPAFLSAWYCMAAIHPEHARGLIDQCMLTIRVVSPEDRADKLDIDFDGPFEGSGTVLTTILNHLGTTLGCICALRQFICDVRYADPALLGEDVKFSQSLVKGFRQVGHTVTWEDCCPAGQFIPEKIQFLKHSPCLTSNGEWISVLNAGAMLRSLGSVDDDLLPNTIGESRQSFARMTHDERINKFVGAVVAGHKHEHPTPILEALRSRFPSQGNLEIRKDSVHLEFEPSLEERVQECAIDVNSWMRRYGLLEHEVSEMVAAISDIRVGQHYKCTGFAKIYATDYGVEPLA